MYKAMIDGAEAEVAGLPELQRLLNEGRVGPDAPVLDVEANTWRTVSAVLRPPEAAQPAAPAPAAAPSRSTAAAPPAASEPAPPPQQVRVVQAPPAKSEGAGRGSGGNVLAALCSFLVPGLGQLTQGRVLAALEHFVAAFVLWIFMLGWIIHILSAVGAATYKPKPGLIEEIARDIRMRKCPACQMEIPKKATVCAYCQTKLAQGR